MSSRPDVVIIGGGIIGCWTAWHLARNGCAVTIIERDKLGSGASSGNCGYICPSHVHPLCGPGAIRNGMRMMAKFGGALSIPPRWDPTLWDWLRRFAGHCKEEDFRAASIARHALLNSSRQQYQQLASRASSEIKWQERGLLMVYRSERDFEAYANQATELREEFDLHIQELDPTQLCRLEPGLRDDLAGGWYFPDDAHVSPIDLLAFLRSELQTLGVVVREQTDVLELCFQGGRLTSIQMLGGESMTADSYIVATGAEAGFFAKQLGCRIPVVPGKGYSVTIEETSGMPEIPMIFEDDHVAVTSFGNSFRIGSTMQLTGFSRSIPAKRIDLLKRSAREHLRVEIPEGREKRWSGWRPMMPDGLPCIGRSLSCQNVLFAAGNGMIGMASGPATGQLVAELALGRTAHVDPHPYRIGRFN